MSSGTVESDSQNFVGNEITNTNAFMGNYALTGSNHFEYGNNVKGTTTPAGTSSLSDSSYYLTAEPAFWMGSSFWPSIGYPNTISSGSIPAKDRFTSGSNFTVCHQDVTTSIAQNPQTKSNISVFPNPVTNELNISIPETTNENAKLQVLDLCGKIIFSSNQKIHSGKNTIADFNAKPGIYLLLIITSDHLINLKFVKN